MKNAIASKAKGRRLLSFILLLEELGGLSFGAAPSEAETPSVARLLVDVARLFLECTGGDGTGQSTGGHEEAVVLLLSLCLGVPSLLPPPFPCNI